MSRRFLVAALSLAFAATITTTASASPSTAPDPKLLDAPPSCVERELDDGGWTDYLWVSNTCTETLWIKVILAKHTDLDCYEYPPRSGKRWDWNYPGQFSGLQLC